LLSRGEKSGRKRLWRYLRSLYVNLSRGAGESRGGGGENILSSSILLWRRLILWSQEEN